MHIKQNKQDKTARSNPLIEREFHAFLFMNLVIYLPSNVIIRSINQSINQNQNQNAARPPLPPTRPTGENGKTPLSHSMCTQPSPPTQHGHRIYKSHPATNKPNHRSTRFFPEPAALPPPPSCSRFLRASRFALIRACFCGCRALHGKESTSN